MLIIVLIRGDCIRVDATVESKASLRKKYVSGVAGGRYCGQSGGRNYFIFFYIFGG